MIEYFLQKVNIYSETFLKNNEGRKSMYDKIKKLCEERKISLRQLEIDTGLGNGAICKWKECSPRLSSVVAVAEYFGITVDELIDKSTN